MTLTRGKLYLLRLINTSVDSTFIFSIDNHNLTIIETDFVPIHPYQTNSVLVAIGQRYHVIVEANSVDDRPLSQQSYWIRTVVADQCGGFFSKPDNRTGIVYYQGADNTSVPSTSINKFPTKCSDEPYESLKPIVPWTVGAPANQQEASTFEAGLEPAPAPGPLPPPGNFSRWELATQPLWLNFSNPTILNVNQAKTSWPPQMVVVPENVPANSWVYLLVTATAFPFGASTGRNFVPASHPVRSPSDCLPCVTSTNDYRRSTSTATTSSFSNSPSPPTGASLTSQILPVSTHLAATSPCCQQEATSSSPSRQTTLAHGLCIVTSHGMQALALRYRYWSEMGRRMRPVSR